MRNGSYPWQDRDRWNPPLALLLVLSLGLAAACTAQTADPSDAGTCAPWGPDAGPPQAPAGQCGTWWRCEGPETPGKPCTHDGYQPGAEPAVTWWCCQ